MSQGDYDFFATGRPVERPTAPPPPTTSELEVPPQANQFGQATDPQGRPVNQFGTPVGSTAVPTGPSLAPGYGGIPVAAHAFGPPGVYAGPPGHGYGLASARPGPVLAAGIISIVCGAILLVTGLVMAVVAMGVSTELGRSGGLAAILAVGVVLTLGLGVLYLVLGIAMVKSYRWAVWTTLALSGLGLLYSLTQLVTGAGTRTTYNAATQMTTTTNHSSSLFSVLLTIAFLALLLVPPSWKWLTRKA